MKTEVRSLNVAVTYSFDDKNKTIGFGFSVDRARSHSAYRTVCAGQKIHGKLTEKSYTEAFEKAITKALEIIKKDLTDETPNFPRGF